MMIMKTLFLLCRQLMMSVHVTNIETKSLHMNSTGDCTKPTASCRSLRLWLDQFTIMKSRNSPRPARHGTKSGHDYGDMVIKDVGTRV